MQIAIIKNDVIETIGELRTIFPNVSFPLEGAGVEFLNENSAMEVIVWEMFDSTLYKLTTVEPYIRDDKVYTYRVDTKTQEEIAYDILKATQAQENAIRSQRNQLLKESDWTQVADAPVDKTAWATYRQALRDVTTQEGFPFNVVFPTPPL